MRSAGLQAQLACRAAATLAALICALPASADFWFEPHPLNRVALIEGRAFDLNAEAFAQRFSYRHLSDVPAPGEDGLRGSGGSLTGDDLYHETTAQVHLNSDSGTHALLFRMRRLEDFDDRFDRQLIGYRYNVSDDLGFTIAGDATGDKSRADLQFGADWRSGTGRLRAVLVLPEFLFNDKQTSEGRYGREPRTLFLHYSRGADQDAWRWQAAINVSPEARFDLGALAASGRQLRAAAELTANGRWATTLRAEFERAERSFDGAPADRFDRTYGTFTVETRDTGRSKQPGVGIRWLTFDESGWFGSRSDAVGDIDRTETTVFASLLWPVGDNAWWEPGLHVTRVDVDHRFAQGPWRDRDQEEWQAKLLLPWRVRLNSEGGTLTLHASVRLHEFDFGGGNIQIHWPL